VRTIASIDCATAGALYCLLRSYKKIGGKARRVRIDSAITKRDFTQNRYEAIFATASFVILTTEILIMIISRCSGFVSKGNNGNITAIRIFRSIDGGTRDAESGWSSNE
jgi:hypothetical protein